MKLKLLKEKKNMLGQSLFEVILALGVITAITVGIVALAVNSIRNANFSKSKTLAGRYSQEAVEWLRSERDEDFRVFSQNAQTPLFCLDTLNWMQIGACEDDSKISGTNLYRDVTFSTGLVSGKTVIEANVRVYWNDAQGYHEARTITSFSDWRER